MVSTFEPRAGIRVVYTDLDGTMLGAGAAFTRAPDGSPTTEPAEALAAAMAAGVEIVPVSGRAMPGVARDGRLLGLATTIGEMGAVVSYHYGRELVTALGEYPGGEEAPTALMEREGAIALLCDRFPLEPHTPWAADRTYTALLRGLADTAEADAALADGGAGWCTLVDNGTLHGAYLGLAAGTSHVYHLMPRGVSKGAGVALDRARRGISRDECVAIGDAVADLAMAAEVASVIVTRDALERDPSLASAVESVGNAAATPRDGNLGWADIISSLC